MPSSQLTWTVTLMSLAFTATGSRKSETAIAKQSLVMEVPSWVGRHSLVNQGISRVLYSRTVFVLIQNEPQTSSPLPAPPVELERHFVAIRCKAAGIVFAVARDEPVSFNLPEVVAPLGEDVVFQLGLRKGTIMPWAKAGQAPPSRPMSEVSRVPSFCQRVFPTPPGLGINSSSESASLGANLLFRRLIKQRVLAALYSQTTTALRLSNFGQAGD